jgi:transposase
MSKREYRYGMGSLARDFPTDEAVLEFLFDAQHSRECSCGGTYSMVKGRRQFYCSKCRFQIAPTANTIFHKSDTPLTLWFKAILAFSNAKSGVSAKYMERELEVTYKTAWRMLNLIRKALEQPNDKLQGDVEMDAAYLGGRKRAGAYNENLSEAIADKAVLMGAVNRQGEVRVFVVPDSTAATHGSFLVATVEPKDTRLMTDSSNRYNKVAVGYNRFVVNHSDGEYVRGDVYTNTIEGFWSHLKRSITGTHKVVSKKHLQSYLNAFAFHYNNRHSDRERFAVLLDTILHATRA